MYSPTELYVVVQSPRELYIVVQSVVRYRVVRSRTELYELYCSGT